MKSEDSTSSSRKQEEPKNGLEFLKQLRPEDTLERHRRRQEKERASKRARRRASSGREGLLMIVGGCLGLLCGLAMANIAFASAGLLCLMLGVLRLLFRD